MLYWAVQISITQERRKQRCNVWQKDKKNSSLKHYCSSFIKFSYTKKLLCFLYGFSRVSHWVRSSLKNN